MPSRPAPYPNCRSGWRISSAQIGKQSAERWTSIQAHLSQHSDSSRGQAYAAAALQGAAAELSAARTGKRNEMLNAMAFRLGRMIARGWVDEKIVADALLGACDANKYLREHGHRATMKTIESGIVAGRKEPHPDLSGPRTLIGR